MIKITNKEQLTHDLMKASVMANLLFRSFSAAAEHVNNQDEAAAIDLVNRTELMIQQLESELVEINKSIEKTAFIRKGLS